MNGKRILELLARARMDIEAAALEAAECDENVKAGRIRGEMDEVRARVDALEARVAIVEGQQ